MNTRLHACLAAAIAVIAASAVRCSAPAADAFPARAALDAPPTGPRLVFLSMGRDTYLRISVAPLDAPETAAFVTPLSCERVYYAGGRGLCLTAKANGMATDYFAEILDDRFQRKHTIALKGNPSRVRVSPDGRRAAATVFESGHSYAEHGQFSTRTLVFDLESGTVLGDLEAFRVLKDGSPFSHVDFNFWGLTFAANGNTFYATLATRGTNYLVRGDLDRREMHVVRAGIECPSLSPDNSRLVFKKRIGSRTNGWWQLAALDLATMTETPLLGETRSVDDQVEWLDNDHVLYQMTGTGSSGADVWVVHVSRNGKARPFARAAYSPAVVRHSGPARISRTRLPADGRRSS
jgi:hypothetical protein